MLKVINHQLYSGNRIRELQLRRPPVNAFDIDLLQRLHSGIEQAVEDGIGAIVVSAHGASFSAGMDVKLSVNMNREKISELFQALGDVTLAVGKSPIPVAFAINGNCLGAGAVFSLFADFRIMSRQASFGITEVRGGMTLGKHVFAALSRILGPHRAQEFIMEAKVIQAERALELGIVDRLEANHLLVSRALAWCDRVLKLPSKAMLETRSLCREDLHEVLAYFEEKNQKARVDDWFDSKLNTTITKVLKT
ncbi:enoyl-CoA hydratase/isomerase family protein [Pseudoteredinibacter isoporae]|uniref:Enoyl-CoA hydratase/carnithine racemase n=1 Tax=Pseudoteredinibacter isoporae TaxID=570281 RepID=A0A7X0JRS4_9GAMM|nr:enoyl-CoA hydratase/isomerase family protein [Pseudoteredinibacter isoporae]MBB6520210.1 enoyl-CoA hydratase/carnithine racemase [Pseudoteredinibacter isoporae]NHO85782.1 enoyl-CoA hydratase/isomerase family protein [Pseudoteredinibacter isoporae]NIB25766.1 enoyl-CoA hydratase/isomerase family protein [Pseudoteredinibacter isoporae]